LDILFFDFLVFGALALDLAKLNQFQFAFHGFGFVAAIINALARSALKLHERFLFCGHNSN
jgi:hypothetical protein